MNECIINEFPFFHSAGTLSMEEPFRRLSKAVATASKQVCFIPTDIAVEMQEEHQILRLIAGTTGTRNKNLT